MSTPSGPTSTSHTAGTPAASMIKGKKMTKQQQEEHEAFKQRYVVVDGTIAIYVFFVFVFGNDAVSA